MSFIPPNSLNLTQVLIKLSATTTQSAAGSFMSFNSISNNTTEISLLNSTTFRLNPNKQYFLVGPTNVITYVNTNGGTWASAINSSYGPAVHGCSFYNATTSQYLTQFPCRFWAFAFNGVANIGFAVLHPTSQTDIKLEYKYYQHPSFNSNQATVGGVFSGSSVVDEPDSYIYIYHN